MDALSGKNSTGRRVSLLNDGPEPPHQLVRLPSITPSLQSRTSSYTSSPVGSPPTPFLMRSHSSDSTNMQTPSPITPDFVFDPGMDSPVFASQAAYFATHQQKELNSAYPPVTQSSGPLPYHHASTSQNAYYRPQQLPEQQINSPAPAANNIRPKKNSYPCPMAKQFHCTDYFTTSGHAARHAKKHTGKKDAYCPECNKAFTRKDNMEQHRRTHQSGRSAAKGGDRDLKKTKPQVKRPKPAPLQSTIGSLSDLSMVDPSLPVSPDGSFMAPAVQPSDPFMDFNNQRSPYGDPTAFSMTHSYPNGPSSYGGLESLAIAASREKRKFES